VLSHTAEPVEIPPQELVDRYLPPYRPQYKLDVSEPHAFGGLAPPEVYMEMRLKMEQAMERALEAFEEADNEFYEIFGRRYGLIEPFRLEGAEIVLITSGTTTSTARQAVDELRDEGRKVGLIKIRVFRPFPKGRLLQALEGAKKVAVIDRNIGLGAGGIFAQEVKAALYNRIKVPVFGFIAGLGGRDITPQTIHEIIDYTETHDEPEDLIWIGVKA